MSEETDDDRPTHLDDIADGCGCVELWEVLSERRAEGASGTASGRTNGGSDSGAEAMDADSRSSTESAPDENRPHRDTPDPGSDGGTE